MANTTHKLSFLSNMSCRGCGRTLVPLRWGDLAAHQARKLHATAIRLDDERPSERSRRNASAAANADIQQLAAASSASASRPPRQLVRRFDPQARSSPPSSGSRQRRDQGATQAKSRDTGNSADRSRRGKGKSNNDRGRASRREEDEKEDDEDGEDDIRPHEREDASASSLIEAFHREDYVNEADWEGHIVVAHRWESALELEEEAAAMMQEGREKGDNELIKQAEALQERVPGELKEALKAAEKTEDESLPRHAPKTVQQGVLPGQVGGLPVGRQGAAGAIEESLRALVNRPNEVYKEPGILAKKAFSGELIKFNNAFEKAKVEERLISMANTSEASKEDRAKSRLHPLSEGAKKAVIKRLVSGQYEDNKGAGSKSDILKKASHYTNGRWDGSSRAMFLDTLEKLMPVAKPAKQEARR